MTRKEQLVLAIAVLASIVVFLDGSVINVALPKMSQDLGGGLSTQQWIVNAYLLTLGSLILLAGSLSDLFGRIGVLRIGLIAFGVASVFIAISPTAELVIIGRALQGVAGALLVPSSLALIIATFRAGAQAKAIGAWTAWTSAAFLAGPLLGGLFVDFLNWRLVFAINILPIAVTLYLLVILKQKDIRREGVSIDVPGAILGVIGLGGPVFALIEQGTYGWASPVIFVPFVVGILSFAAFIWWQTKAKAPMLPLGLFTIRNFSAGNIATTFVYAALNIGGFITVVFLQQVAGLSATLAALAFLPVTIASIGLSTYFGALSGKYGPRVFMTVGPTLAGIGYLLFLRIGENVNYWWDVLPGVLVFSLGLAMTVAPLTAAILGSVSPGQSGIGSATNNAISRVAGLIGIAMIGVIVGGTLDTTGFHRVLVVTAVLFFLGGAVSFVGIRKQGGLVPAVAPPPEPTAALS